MDSFPKRLPQPSMLLHALLFLSLPLQALSADETVLGVYIFSRHGDRTPKGPPPSKLTSLGYSQIYEHGTYYRNRYIASNATNQIANISSDTVTFSQLAVSAPLDNVLMNSAQAFLQGLYPPVGSDASTEVLRNESKIQAPMDGYQLIPISTVNSGTGSEDSAWLQGASNCANAKVSSNQYYTSSEYKSLHDTSLDFFRNLTPRMNGTFGESDMVFKNAYSIFDHLNVASIHNTTFTPLSPSDSTHLSSLAATQQYSLAYNATSPVRAIAGAVLAGEILEALNASLASVSDPETKAPKLNIQFGAYASFLAFFGLAALPADRGFTGINDYASSMAFELFTTAANPPYAETDLRVRFLFNNGSSSPTRDLTPYPLFGSSSPEMSWSSFQDGMAQFAVTGQAQWCQACGNSTGSCAAASASGAPGIQSGKGGGGAMSKTVAGVIGAMVTLAVVLGVEAIVMLAAGVRVVKKGSLVGRGQGGDEGGGVIAKTASM